MTMRHFHAVAAGLLAGALIMGASGCFETTDKSIRKLRVFYSSDMVGSLEPCG